jgi:ethanolamine utilization protein EutN
VTIATVLGHVVATHKHPKLEGVRLMLVQGLELDGRIEGDPFVAIDRLGAGPGERVLVMREGRGAIEVLGVPQGPIDAAIVGIIDTVDLLD